MTASTILLEAPVPVGSQLRFTYFPESAEFSDTRMRLAFANHAITRSYRDATQTLAANPIRDLRVEALTFTYYDNTNTEIGTDRHGQIPPEQISNITAIQLDVTITHGAKSKSGTAFITLRNAKPVAEGGAGEFVVNAAVEAHARQVAASAEPIPWGESEFELVGLEPAPSVRVKAPRVAEAPVAFECRTLQVVRTNPGQAAGGNLVLGEVVWIHVADDLVDERLRVDPERLAAIGRMGGVTYCRTRDRFDLPRGRAALEDG